MKRLILALTLAATPLYAGGPVIIEDTESAPVAVQPKRDHTALWIIGGIVVLGLLAGGGSSNLCNGPDDVPTPEPGGC